MNLPGFVAHRKRVVAVALLLFAVTHAAFAQSDVQRETVAITYPLDNTVSVKFRGTTQLPRLSGEAKIRRTARRGTRIELSIDNLPRATELGAPTRPTCSGRSRPKVALTISAKSNEAISLSLIQNST